jgi:transcriptional regulator with XRE-family HTH domain
MKKNDAKEQLYSVKTDDLDNLTAAFVDMIKKIMGDDSASKFAKKCGFPASTITRIRNGEIKRSVRDDTLLTIWENRDSKCKVTYDQLVAANVAISEAYLKKDNARWEQERKEVEFLENQILNNMLRPDSDFFLKKSNERFEIIPNMDLYPDMAYELAFQNGETKHVLFFTQFHSKRRIEQMEQVKKEDPQLMHYSSRHYRTIMDFQELRILHPKFTNAELVIVFNYEDDFKYNANTLKQLSKKDHVSLALMHFDFEKLSRSGRLLEEICLDGRKKGILSELNLIRG